MSTMDTQQFQTSMPPQAPQETSSKKKILIYSVIGILIVILAFGLYAYFYIRQKVCCSEPVSDILGNEEVILDEDVADLESFSADKSLDTLEQDMTSAAGERVIIETASVENLEKELSDELNSLTNDLTNLETLNNDTSLDNLDSGLMSAGQ